MQERTFLLDSKKTEPIRKEWGLQTKIACEMAVSRHRLNLWLMGKNAISETYLRKLCSIISYKPEELLTDESIEFLSNLLILA